MIDWFHRSMNHGLNSATDTGHDRKKQGPEGDRITLSTFPALYPVKHPRSPDFVYLTYKEVRGAVLL